MIDAPGLPTVRVDQARPPLTQDLVKNAPIPNWALQRWPAAQPVVARLRQTLRRSVGGVTSLEKELAEFAAGARDRPENARAMTATQFLLADVLAASVQYMSSGALSGGMTVHADLVGDLMTWVSRGPSERRVVVVSFNYDPLFERALEARFGGRVEPTRPTLGDHITVLKPHGSLNWVWPCLGYRGQFSGNAVEVLDLMNDRLLDLQPDRSAPLEVVPLETFGNPQVVALKTPKYPAFAPPVADKSDFIWPEEQRQLFEDLQGRVTRLVTVGWRAAEPHFLDLLRPKVKEWATALVVTGGDPGRATDEANEIRNRLLGVTDLRERNVDLFTSGFSELVDGAASPLVEFLEEPDQRPRW